MNAGGYQEGPGRWRIVFPWLPPSINHSHINLPTGGRVPKGTTKAFVEDIAKLLMAARFRPKPDDYFAVGITFTMPTWRHDIDSGLKVLLDACFGTRQDQKVVHVTLNKRVEKDVECTEVRIMAVDATGNPR